MRAAMITEYQRPLKSRTSPILNCRQTGSHEGPGNRGHPSDWHTWMGHYGDDLTADDPGHEMAGDGSRWGRMTG